MSDQTNTPNQHQLLSSVRALLQGVQQPLDALDEALQRSEQLLTELAPALDVVDFSPFAQLTVNGADTWQPAPKPVLRSTGIPPVATTAAAAVSQATPAAPPSSTRPGATPQATSMNDPLKMAPPVFSLPSQKRATTVGASSSASRDALADHALAQLVTPPTAPLVGSEGGYADRSTPLSRPGDADRARVPSAGPMSAEQRTQQGGSLPGINTAAPPLATMSLLATVVDSLLAATPAGRFAASAPQGTSAPGMVAVPASSASSTSSGMQGPTAMTTARHSALLTNDNPISPFQQPPVATHSVNAPPADLATLLAGWPSVGYEYQPTNQLTNQPTNQLTNQPANQPTPDPWTLAQLINDVLAEEARRHGVDLS